MTKRAVTLLVGILFAAAPRVFAQQKTITGKVTSEQGMPLPGVSIVIRGTIISTSSNNDGNYAIRVAVGQVLQFRLIGAAPLERTVGAEDVINVELRRVAVNLDAVVVTALGQTTTQRALGYSQQSVQGPEIAQTQRENFVNALAGRVAGMDVTSTSGVPGASSSITIRGVSSISSSNQPLIIVDGLPMDNKTLNTAVLASELSSNTALSNPGVGFTHRAPALNPDGIQKLHALQSG